MPETNRIQLLAYGVFAVAVVLVGMRFMQHERSSGASAGPASAAAPSASDGGGSVRIARPAASGSVVHVAGAVRHPGVYRLPAGARVQDAVRRAGGARRGADVNAINLAAKVVDGQQVVVPRRASQAGSVAASAGAADGAAAPSAGAAAGAPISLSTATAEQLDTLEGVGPATARKIIEWRVAHGGFRSVQDLTQVPGIGPKKLAALKDEVQP